MAKPKPNSLCFSRTRLQPRRPGAAGVSDPETTTADDADHNPPCTTTVRTKVKVSMASTSKHASGITASAASSELITTAPSGGKQNRRQARFEPEAEPQSKRRKKQPKRKLAWRSAAFPSTDDHHHHQGDDDHGHHISDADRSTPLEHSTGAEPATTPPARRQKPSSKRRLDPVLHSERGHSRPSTKASAFLIGRIAPVAACCGPRSSHSLQLVVRAQPESVFNA